MSNTPNPEDPIETKTRWQTIAEAMSSPIDFIQHWSKKSPILTIMAVVFLLQPVISTSISLVDEWRQVKTDLNPANRPVTEQELDLVNQKLDFLQNLILKDIDNDTRIIAHQHAAHAHQASPPATDPAAQLQQLQNRLNAMQKKLDNAYTHQQQAPQK